MGVVGEACRNCTTDGISVEAALAGDSCNEEVIDRVEPSLVGGMALHELEGVKRTALTVRSRGDRLLSTCAAPVELGVCR